MHHFTGGVRVPPDTTKFMQYLDQAGSYHALLSPAEQLNFKARSLSSASVLLLTDIEHALKVPRYAYDFIWTKEYGGEH